MWQAVAAMIVIATTGEERLWRLSGRRYETLEWPEKPVGR
jgi:hypothetical protein